MLENELISLIWKNSTRSLVDLSSDVNAIKSAVTDTITAFGGIDILINNAATSSI
ncbi:hypothetical protein [Paenibacillus phytorum]|uniref:hypothetical protein n=1 Tax=Paenibacillus phytorum TaxID=2654977 RepID=UPI0014916D4B|nr:hypothetical protein [Paenibacillus phytorum]